MVLYSENDILKLIDFNETIQKFAKEKARKKCKLLFFLTNKNSVFYVYIIFQYVYNKLILNIIFCLMQE